MKFDSIIFERGRKYLQQNKVKNIIQTKNGYEADVLGSYLYHVSALVKNGKVSSMKCDCPYANSGNHCKHEAALYIYIMKNAKQKKSDDKGATKESLKDEVESIYQNVKSSRKGIQQCSKKFIEGLDALFEKEKKDALKKFDKDVFNRWFNYIDKAYQYIQQNYWNRSYWMDGFSACVEELIIKNVNYKKMFIRALAKGNIHEHCKPLVDFLEGSIEELNAEDKLYFKFEHLKQIEDKELINTELFNILLQANQDGQENYLTCLEYFKEYKKYESYQYILIVSSKEEQGKVFYEDYKNTFGKNTELEAILYKEEEKIKAFYNDLAYHMEYKNRDLISLFNLIGLYGDRWINVCEEFYLFLKNRIPKKQVDSIICGIDDYQYMALQMMKFSGTRLNQEYMQVIYDKDKDLYKHIVLQNFIRAIEKSNKLSYYWFDDIYRDFNYSVSKADALEALSYAKQYFKDNTAVIKEIDNRLRQYL